MRAVARFVDLWVRLYTTGLDGPVRERRREEIAADVWEQAAHLHGHGWPQANVIAAILVRCVRGMPDDVLWRFETAAERTRDDRRREGSVPMQRSGSRIELAVPGAAVVLAIVAAIAVIAIDNIQYVEQSERFVPSSTLGALTIGLLVGGLVSTVVGFAVMGARPMTGATLAAGGAVVAGLMVYWLIVPLVVAVLVAAYSVRRARRLAVETGG